MEDALLFTVLMNFKLNKPLSDDEFNDFQMNAGTNTAIAMGMERYLRRDYPGNDKWGMAFFPTLKFLSPTEARVEFQIQNKDKFNYRYLNLNTMVDALNHAPSFPGGTLESASFYIEIPFRPQFKFNKKDIEKLNHDFQLQKDAESLAFKSAFEDVANANVEYEIWSKEFGTIELTFYNRSKEDDVNIQAIMDYFKPSYGNYVFPLNKEVTNIRSKKLLFES